MRIGRAGTPAVGPLPRSSAVVTARSWVTLQVVKRFQAVDTLMTEGRVDRRIVVAELPEDLRRRLHAGGETYE